MDLLIKWLRSPRTAAVALTAAGMGTLGLAMTGGRVPFLQWTGVRVLVWGLYALLLTSTLACTCSLLIRWVRGGGASRPVSGYRPFLVTLFHLGLAMGMVLFAAAPFFSWEGVILIREGSRLGEGDPDLKIIQQGFLARPTLGGNSLTLEAVNPQYRVPGYKEGVASYLTLVDDTGWRSGILTRQGPIKLGSVEVYQRSETGVSVALVARGTGENQVTIIDISRDEIDKGETQTGEIRGLGKVEVGVKPLDVPSDKTARGTYGVEVEVKEGKTFLMAGEKVITSEGMELIVDDMVYWTGLTLEHNPVYHWLAGVLGLTAAIFAVSRFL